MLLTTKRRLGVIGLSKSGKTVFLTSLIDHIKKHNPERFRIKDKKIIRAKDVHLKGKDVWRRFPYEQYRNAMADKHAWPDPTMDYSHFRIQFEIANGWKTHILTLYDFPGERLGDVSLYVNDYAVWSKCILDEIAFFIKQIESSKRLQASKILELSSKIGREFLNNAETLPESDSEEETIRKMIDDYKLLAVGMRYLRQKISPSSLLLDKRKRMLSVRKEAKGTYPPKEAPLELLKAVAQQFRSGLDGKEFCPLGEGWTKTSQWRRMEKCYEEYKSKEVHPLFSKIFSCDGLVVLVNIVDILKYGENEYKDVQEMLKHIGDIISPAGKIGILLQKLGLAAGPKRVAVAASQCDLFLKGDRDILRDLLKGLLVGVSFDPAKYMLFTCASVRCTKTCENTLVPLVRQEGEEPVLITPLSLREQFEKGWPEDLKWNTKLFCEAYKNKNKVLPCFPKDGNAPPNLNLNKIFTFVTRWFE